MRVLVPLLLFSLFALSFCQAPPPAIASSGDQFDEFFKKDINGVALPLGKKLTHSSNFIRGLFGKGRTQQERNHVREFLQGKPVNSGSNSYVKGCEDFPFCGNVIPPPPPQIPAPYELQQPIPNKNYPVLGKEIANDGTGWMKDKLRKEMGDEYFATDIVGDINNLENINRGYDTLGKDDRSMLFG